MTPEKVFSFIDFKDLKVDVNTSFNVKFKEGAIGSFLILGEDPLWRMSMRIWGENGVIEMDENAELREGYVQFKGREGKEKIEYKNCQVNNPAEDLIECIRKGKQPETSFEVIEKTAYLSDEIYKNCLRV